MHSLRLIWQLYLGFAMIAQSTLVLRGVIFLEICLHCNSELQLAMVSKQSMQSLQKVELISICATVESTKVHREKLQREYVTRCNLPAICVATSLTQVAKKRAPFYFFSVIVKTFWKHHKLQPENAICTMPLATSNGFLFPALRDKLQEKLHRATLD